MITKAPRFYLFDVGVAGHLTGRRIERAAGSAIRRTRDGIRILPWERFLERLWGDGIVE